MSLYRPRYPDLLSKAGVRETDLPAGLQTLISRYVAAIHALAQAGESSQQRLLFIVVQADAVISAAVHGLYKEATGAVQVDKVKLMALKAKALRLKQEQGRTE